MSIEEEWEGAEKLWGLVGCVEPGEIDLTKTTPKIKEDIKMISQLFQGISSIPLSNSGSNTQLTSSNHESRCSSIFEEKYQTQFLDKTIFRSFVVQNGCQVCDKSENALNRSCVHSIPITNNSINLITNQNYIINQPAGPQDFPDMMMIRLDMENNLQLAYIECKSPVPKFNNNPPKMNKNCIYICGNKMFSGFLLTTQEWQDRKNEYIQRYNSLAQEFTSQDMKVTPYRVIELNWIKGRGPQCFIDREEQNIPLITECLSRF
jgi:hypothetical protein